MGPPQVDMDKKQPLEDVQGWAEKVGDMKLPVWAPVPVESGTTVGGKRACGNRRCKSLLVGFIVGFVIAVLLCIAAVAIHHRIHRHHRHDDDHDEWDCALKKGHHRKGQHHHHSSEEDDKEDDDDGNEHYKADGSKLHIARNGTHHFFKLQAIVDFDILMAGFKDMDRQRCYVDRLPPKPKDGMDDWRRCKHEKKRHPEERPLHVVKPPMSAEVLRYVAGEEINKLCIGLPTHWVVPVNTDALDDNTFETIYL